MTEQIKVIKGGQRIDKYLTEHFPYSRNFFHHIIDRGGVEIRGKKVKKSYKLKDGDKIDIDELERYLDGTIMEEAPHIDIPVVHEEDDFLIISKPKGVLSHPNSIRDIGAPSVVGRLYHTYKDLPSIGNFIRAGLIHRLDKETDGLMIIAKTEAGLKHFKDLFQKKSESETIKEKEATALKKYYKARCHVTPEGKEFLDSIGQEFPHYIIEDVLAKVPHAIPKEGITKILGYEIKDDIAAMDIEILTGRTHQIRFHLSSLGLPIVGDYLYGEEEETLMQLTAYRLVYEDLEHNTKETVNSANTI